MIVRVFPQQLAEAASTGAAGTVSATAATATAKIAGVIRELATILHHLCCDLVCAFP
jgi:hypothetical protein